MKVKLLLILLLGLVLRILNLSSNPPELYTDELANISSAASVIETGKDLEGNTRLYFSDRVEMRPPIYGYSTYLSSLLFGDNIFAYRLPAVVFGLLTIYLVYKIALLFFDEKTALWSAFTLAILPWHIHYSRIGWEPAAFLPFLLTGIYSFVSGVKSKDNTRIVLGYFLLGMTVLAYHSALLYSVIFVALLTVVYYKCFSSRLKVLLTGLITFTLIISPFVFLINKYPQYMERSQRISVFADGITLDAFKQLTINYLLQFSPDFLFINGDPNLRHGAGTGALYLWMLPMIAIALCLLLEKIKSTESKLLLAWLIIYPLAAALTSDGNPHATRTLVGAPLFAILTGLGMVAVIQHVNRKTLTNFIYLAIAIAFVIFARKYYVEYPARSADVWQYGHKKVFYTINSLASSYERVCLGNLDYWGNKPLIYYYLNNSHLEIIETDDDTRCMLSKSIVVSKAEKPILSGAMLREQVLNYKNNQVLYLINTID